MVVTRSAAIGPSVAAQAEGPRKVSPRIGARPPTSGDLLQDRMGTLGPKQPSQLERTFVEVAGAGTRPPTPCLSRPTFKLPAPAATCEHESSSCEHCVTLSKRLEEALRRNAELEATLARYVSSEASVAHTVVNRVQPPPPPELSCVRLVVKGLEAFAEWELTSVDAAVVRRLNGTLGTDLSALQVEKRFPSRLGSVGAVVRLQAKDARLIMSRKRRILGCNDLLSIARDLPKEERDRLYEARLMARARADTARARALGMSPSPAPQLATAAHRDASQPEEGELPNPALPPAMPGHAGAAPAQRCKNRKARSGRADRRTEQDVVAKPGAMSASDAGPVSEPPHSPQASPRPPSGCKSAPPTAAPEPISEQPADTAASSEAGEGDTPAEAMPHDPGCRGVAVADADAGADNTDHNKACSSSG